MTKKKTPVAKKKEKKAKVVKRTVRCRSCFMVDSYTVEEKKCRHCGAVIFLLDAV
jgi:ribosomal protein L37E